MNFQIVTQILVGKQKINYKSM